MEHAGRDCNLTRLAPTVVADMVPGGGCLEVRTVHGVAGAGLAGLAAWQDLGVGHRGGKLRSAPEDSGARVVVGIAGGRIPVPPFHTHRCALLVRPSRGRLHWC